MTQLNTSPWPTTGTSPVQSSSQSSTTNNWSNFANMSSSTSSSPANNMSKMGTLGPVQHVTSHPGVSPSDPFGAAPATNLQNSGTNHNYIIFYTEIFTGKIVWWSLFTRELSGKNLQNSTFSWQNLHIFQMDGKRYHFHFHRIWKNNFFLHIFWHLSIICYPFL